MPFNITQIYAEVALAVLAVGGACWKGISMWFNLNKKVSELDIKVTGNSEKIDKLEQKSTDNFDKLTENIKDLGDKTENRHDRIEDKLDQLIVRSLPP